MLRVTIHETDQTLLMKLEGRITGPWVDELRRAWIEITPRAITKDFSIDLSDLIYADSLGELLLREIHSQTSARLIATTPWTQFLAEEIATKTNPVKGARTCGQ